MYDMKPLEEEWLRYQTKKRKPWYMFSIFLIITLLIILLLMNKNEIKIGLFKKYVDNIDQVSNKNIVLNKNKNSQLLLLNAALKRLEVVDTFSKVQDSLHGQINNNSSRTDILVDIPILDQESEDIIVQKNNDSHRKKVYLDIIETTSMSAYEDVEKRFHQSHDIDDALFLAKSYYKKGNYEKAEQWAFETNKLDSTLEESFLIFVKAKMKLGHRNEVLAILNQYLKQNNSKDVRVLLDQIKSNKFQ